MGTKCGPEEGKKRSARLFRERRALRVRRESDTVKRQLWRYLPAALTIVWAAMRPKAMALPNAVPVM